jgi:hypothetical protein
MNHACVCTHRSIARYTYVTLAYNRRHADMTDSGSPPGGGGGRHRGRRAHLNTRATAGPPDAMAVHRADAAVHRAAGSTPRGGPLRGSPPSEPPRPAAGPGKGAMPEPPEAGLEPELLAAGGDKTEAALTFSTANSCHSYSLKQGEVGWQPAALVQVGMTRTCSRTSACCGSCAGLA